jgi:ComF family protein
MTLPYTNDWEEFAEKCTYKLFFGRVQISAASSYLYFRKKSGVQKILHELKYRNHESLGNLMGRLHASQLIDSKDFQDIDLVMPIPLHPRKYKERGYNQAALLAEGYAEIFGAELDLKTLQRKADTESQTRKSRYQRYENMKGVFVLNHQEKIKEKIILLIDDVVTTGATIESSAELLIAAGAKKVLVASIAVAKKNG